MAAKKNGRNRGEQPARPSRKVTEKVESVVTADHGTTIREEFAKAALQGLLASNRRYDDEATAAAHAVKFADATIAALGNGGAP